jgi:hypothetical protein
VQVKEPQFNFKLSVQVEDHRFKALYLEKKEKKRSKSYIAGIGSARQQTSTQFHALNQDEDCGFRALYSPKKIKKS